MAQQLVSDKVITLEPSRNLLSFNNFNEINYQIINEPLEILIAMLKLIIPLELIDDGKTNIEIRRNHLNYMIRVNTKREQLVKILLRSFLDAENCCYLEINGRIHRKKTYRDILSLEYDPRSFRQPDDSIREYIIQWFQKNVSRGWNTMLFFGGECVLLGKILSGYSALQYFYTDFPSIYDDIQRNYKAPLAELIDYKEWNASRQWQVDFSDIRRCCIINTGYQGMGEHLAREICRIAAEEMYIISCNQYSWSADLTVLNEYYNLQENIEIRTNYSVWIYKLSRRI